MAFFRKSKNQNYDFLSGYSWYTPGVKGLFVLLGWLLVGALLGNIIAAIFMMFLKDSGEAMEYATLISYPIMFIPPMLYAKHASNRNMAFDPGYRIDNNNFSPVGGWILAALVMVGTLGCALCMDSVNSQMPPMPKWLEDALGSMTGGTLWVNFLCVSIFAPIFEEWLCRGMILRGLLNYERVTKEGEKVRGLKPIWAIVISALFFALIHMNPWQAIPAFTLGILFGYVYYRTGSLKLTMLMHFSNNTMALTLSRIDSIKDAESMLEIMSPAAYWSLFVVGIAVICLLIWVLGKVTLHSPRGNCDELPVDVPVTQ